MTIPIVFAFDKNLVMPACVCISSLLMNAKKDTSYDIFILHPVNQSMTQTDLVKLPEYYDNCKLTFRPVGNEFDNAFEIRGITTPAYYRLLIPEIIPEYDKIIYSDVDVIFRSDLTEIFEETDMTDCCFAGVKALAQFVPSYKKYYEKEIGINPEDIIYSGNLIINSEEIRRRNLVNRFRELAKNKYMFQDMDILNIACKGRIKYMGPDFCFTTFINQLAVEDFDTLASIWNKESIERAFASGIIHYNGNKPWKDFCINFDIWWEYYRKSPFFDEKFYFDFFYRKINDYDLLPLWKRVKILLRYFVFGRRIV